MFVRRAFDQEIIPHSIKSREMRVGSDRLFIKLKLFSSNHSESYLPVHFREIAKTTLRIANNDDEWQLH